MTMVFATTTSANEKVRTSDGKLPEEKPGWFVELSRRAATACGAKLDFAFMPWPRALQMVERGEVQAAFNSSYTEFVLALRRDQGLAPQTVA